MSPDIPYMSYLFSSFCSSTGTSSVLFSATCSPQGRRVTVSFIVFPQSTFVFTFSLRENCNLSSHTYNDKMYLYIDVLIVFCMMVYGINEKTTFTCIIRPFFVVIFERDPESLTSTAWTKGLCPPLLSS